MLRYMPAHWHRNQYFEIYYALSGECPVHFTNEVITLTPGAVLIVAPNVLHANPCYGDDKVLLYYCVRSTTFEQVFWNLIARLRMDRAALLLRCRTLSMEEIATATGYANVSSFSRSFTRYYQCTPVEYQKKTV